MDIHVVLKFLADLLYIKRIICYEEYDDILSSACCDDLDFIIEKLMKEGYNTRVTGELE